MNTSPTQTARFVFGLVGLIGILAFLSQMDDEKGTDYTWGYIVIVWLGILTFQADKITAGIQDLQNAIGSNAFGSPETTGRS